MKIDKVAGGHVPQSSLKQTARPVLETPVRKPAQEPQLNANVTALEQAQQQLKTLPDVDMAKVESIKNALQRGELDLNMAALAQAVMKYHTGHE
ncbi:flagellar biosynthesis anti-sigma factor FlgM [Vibrio sp. SM6]|uniref:Negative regulator of flagellin synthesis n=1 Tax=Vibrio agarilyticus TaxID=2726741 RepID=A0A7X8TSZ7_9VIBR|nr:flagellar biosynthesis anti-sigma factor FlgM [Vibrio agarilyticus]NLS13738.1 flagellar biosynthesis anti-sigma factor FlgM [Vibrio agarilyticus]